MSVLLPSSRVTMLPADSCFWSVIDGSVAGGLRGPAKTRAMLYALEPDLPLPIEDVHAVFLANGDGSIAACACRRDELARLAESADVVTPEEIPEWIACDAAAAEINLLGSGVSSVRVRRTQRTQLAVLLAVSILLSGFVSAGLYRRGQALGQDENDLRAAINSAQSLVLPPAGPNAQPASIRLAAALRTVSFENGSVQQSTAPPATDSLGQVLATWPGDARLKRLTIGKQDIRIDLTMPAEQDPSRFIGKLEELKGWKLSAPVIRRSQNETTLSLSLQRTEEGAG